MIVEDFVMLGTTVPEPNSDGRVFVCSAGYSPELRQLIRVYPLARFGAPHRWSVNQVRLERNPRDSRAESWKIAADRTPAAHNNINAAFTEVGQLTASQRVGAFDHVVVKSIAEANDRRLSLAIIHPQHVPELTFDHNPDSPDSPELRLFDVGGAASGMKRFLFIPRLTFHDEGGAHRLMLRDWGCFEFMRKHGYDQRHSMWRGLHLSERSSLLVGNLSHKRNAWLVIAVLNGLKSQQRSLFEQDAAA